SVRRGPIARAASPRRPIAIRLLSSASRAARARSRCAITGSSAGSRASEDVARAQLAGEPRSAIAFSASFAPMRLPRASTSVRARRTAVERHEQLVHAGVACLGILCETAAQDGEEPRGFGRNREGRRGLARLGERTGDRLVERQAEAVLVAARVREAPALLGR